MNFPVKTLNDLVLHIVDTPTLENDMGYAISPTLEIQFEGKLLKIDKIWIRGDNKLVIEMKNET